MLESLIRLPNLPPQNSTLVLSGSNVELGGSAFNIFWHLFHFGRRPRFIGVAGRQDIEFVRSFLPSGSEKLLELELVSGQTDRLLSFVTPHAHRSVYCMANFPERVAARIRTHCKRSEVLLMAGSRHACLRKQFARMAREFGGSFLGFNPSYAVFEYSSAELLPVLAAADVVCLNAQEEEHVRSTLEISSTLGLCAVIKGILVVTRSIRGVEIHVESKKRLFPISKPIAGNAIGAGDAFIAAFVDALLAGRKLENAVVNGLRAGRILADSGKVRPIISASQIQG